MITGFVDLLLPAELVYGLCYGMVKRFVADSSEICVIQDVKGSTYDYNLMW